MSPTTANPSLVSGGLVSETLCTFFSHAQKKKHRVSARPTPVHDCQDLEKYVRRELDRLQVAPRQHCIVMKPPSDMQEATINIPHIKVYALMLGLQAFGAIAPPLANDEQC
jgi:hypothetical protein